MSDGQIEGIKAAISIFHQMQQNVWQMPNCVFGRIEQRQGDNMSTKRRQFVKDKAYVTTAAAAAEQTEAADHSFIILGGGAGQRALLLFFAHCSEKKKERRRPRNLKK